MTSTTSPIITTHQGGVSQIRLNRPERLNAVNSQLVEELITSLDDAVAAGSRLIVLAGDGRAFSAGFDLGGLDRQSDADLLYRFVRVEQLLQKLYRLPVTSLALVQGRCFGAAADMVAACRFRIASPEASFRMPGLQFGIVLGTRRLARLIGDDAAFDLLETSKIFSAQEALACGFVTAIAPQDQWPEIIAAHAGKAAALPAAAKTALLAATRDDAGLDADMAALVNAAATPGLANRMRTFVATQVKK
ncbi:MAG: enoyl-CoA hydratase/isomerase family protein [Alphaproteobacteria bacterium]|nr:enoyl-CoA hydratase/isomerase family protein [Alphaproteobacteria bacterium]